MQTTIQNVANATKTQIQDEDQYDALMSSFDENPRQGNEHQSPKNQNNLQRENGLQQSIIKRNKMNLHQLYPALSKSFNEQVELKRSQQKAENPFIQQTMIKSSESASTSVKFQKYLNEQIYKFALNQAPPPITPSFLVHSPPLLPRDYSLHSVESSFYRPEAYSLNLSRSYIPNFLSLGNPTIYQYSPANSKQDVEKKLKYIFDYYAETYLQPTKKYQTFDAVGKRVMKFQSFTLFAKDFKLLKIIFKLDTIKKVYKRQSDFGKVLKFSNFMNLIEALSHEKQSNSYFKLEETVPGISSETKSLLQIQQLYAYMGLNEDIVKIKDKFSKIFLPFNCQNQAEFPKIKFNYRKLSLPDLHKKALPELRESKSIKSRINMKQTQKMDPSPFDNEKQLLISWQMLRSKSLKNTDVVKHSTTKVKKMIKQDPEDKIYLNEYREGKSISRNLVEQKIKEIKKIEDKKSHRMIENLQKIEDRIFLSKLNLQKKLSRNKL